MSPMGVETSTEVMAVAVRPSGVSTRTLFLLVVVVSLALSWVTNEFVLTSAVYHRLFDAQLETTRIDQNLDITRRYALWGYLLLPLVLWVRLAFVALSLQMVALLALIELPFRDLFRATVLAFFALIYGNAIRVLWLLRLGEDQLDAAQLNVVPGSLAHFLLSPQESPSLVYGLTSLLNPWELIWATVLILALRATDRIAGGRAALLVGAVWSMFALLQVGVGAFLTGIG